MRNPGPYRIDGRTGALITSSCSWCLSRGVPFGELSGGLGTPSHRGNAYPAGVFRVPVDVCRARLCGMKPCHKIAPSQQLRSPSAASPLGSLGAWRWGAPNFLAGVRGSSYRARSIALLFLNGELFLGKLGETVVVVGNAPHDRPGVLVCHLVRNRASFLCTKAPMPRVPNELSGCHCQDPFGPQPPPAWLSRSSIVN